MTARASTARSRSHGRETGPSVFHHPFFFFTSPSGATPLRWHNPRPTQCFFLSAGGQYRHAPCQVSVRGDEVAGSTPGVVVCSREPGLDRETVPGHQAHQPCPAPPTVFHTGARGRGKERVLPTPAAPAHGAQAGDLRYGDLVRPQGRQEEDLLQPVAEYDLHKGRWFRHGLHAGAIQARDLRGPGVQADHREARQGLRVPERGDGPGVRLEVHDKGAHDRQEEGKRAKAGQAQVRQNRLPRVQEADLG